MKNLIGHPALKNTIQKNLLNLTALKRGLRPAPIILPLDRGEGRSSILNYAAKAYSAAGAVPLTGSREAFIECSAEPGFTAESLQNEVDNAGIYCRYNGVLGCDFSSMVKYLDDPEETRKVFDIMKSLSRHTFLIVFTAEQAIGREEKMVSALCKAFPSVVRLAPYSYTADDLALIMASELTKYQVEIPMQQLRGIADNLPKKKVQYALDALWKSVLESTLENEKKQDTEKREKQHDSSRRTLVHP